MHGRAFEVLGVLVAVGLIVAGAGMIYAPLAPIVAGVVLLAELLTRKG
jgi:hypothetical protein